MIEFWIVLGICGPVFLVGLISNWTKWDIIYGAQQWLRRRAEGRE